MALSIKKAFSGLLPRTSYDDFFEAEESLHDALGMDCVSRDWRHDSLDSLVFGRGKKSRRTRKRLGDWYKLLFLGDIVSNASEKGKKRVESLKSKFKRKKRTREDYEARKQRVWGGYLNWCLNTRKLREKNDAIAAKLAGQLKKSNDTLGTELRLYVDYMDGVVSADEFNARKKSLKPKALSLDSNTEDLLRRRQHDLYVEVCVNDVLAETFAESERMRQDMEDVQAVARDTRLLGAASKFRAHPFHLDSIPSRAFAQDYYVSDDDTTSVSVSHELIKKLREMAGHGHILASYFELGSRIVLDGAFAASAHLNAPTDLESRRFEVRQNRKWMPVVFTTDFENVGDILLDPYVFPEDGRFLVYDPVAEEMFSGEISDYSLGPVNFSELNARKTRVVYGVSEDESAYLDAHVEDALARYEDDSSVFQGVLEGKTNGGALVNFESALAEEMTALGEGLYFVPFTGGLANRFGYATPNRDLHADWVNYFVGGNTAGDVAFFEWQRSIAGGALDNYVPILITRNPDEHVLDGLPEDTAIAVYDITSRELFAAQLNADTAYSVNVV